MRFCSCDQQSRSAILYILSDPGSAKFDVRITCTTCHHPVFIELNASVESEDLQVLLDRELLGSDIAYKLKLGAAQ